MKKIVTLFAALVSLAAVFAAPTITGITAQQRIPINGLVDVVVDISGAADEAAKLPLTFSAIDAATGDELSVLSISEEGASFGSGTSWTRKFVWEARTDVGKVKIDNVQLSVKGDFSDLGVQLWENGPYWAECNVGATKPEEYGYYFWWGDTVGYTHIGGTWSYGGGARLDVEWISSTGVSTSPSPFSLSICPTANKTIEELQSTGYIDLSGNLSAAHDAATAQIGAPWRMPTNTEFEELLENCEISYMARNDVSGVLIKGRGAYSSRSIFLPRAGSGHDTVFNYGYSRYSGEGCYWSSTPQSYPSDSSAGFNESSFFSVHCSSFYRYQGLPVRPVLESCSITTCLEYDGRTVTNPVFTPIGGTTFNSSLSISMSCASEGATIHYTTDGSEPTMVSPEYKRFRIYGKTTVKARAFYENGNCSEIVTAEYALGQCPDPVITTTGGETFYHKGNLVAIAYDCEEGVIHYTTDGSEPTKESPVYEGPFTIDESTVVKAKAFSDNYFDSAVVTATLTREWETVATPVIAAAESFTGAKTKVEITCATEGATIRYTLNGSDPNSHAKKYTGPFYVTEGCTVKAYAVLVDYTNSEIATKAITKVWGIGDSVALPDQQFATSGDAQWVDVSGEAMKSGEIADEQRSILSTTFVGKGALAFKWKVSCEEDEDEHNWDHAAFFVDGIEIARQDGQTDWLEITHSIETEGEHAVQWVYVKDDAESGGEDCMWLKDVVWMPEKTQTTEVPVPTAWLKAKYPSLGDYYFDYEERANEVAANGVNTVWECYVIGLEPTAAEAKFEAAIEMVEGVPKVTWSPDLGAERVYKILGSTDLKTWAEVTETTKGTYNFFKVAVEMP